MIPHPGWRIFHLTDIAEQRSWQYECMTEQGGCGKVFHTCGDNPRALCNDCTTRKMMRDLVCKLVGEVPPDA